MGLLVLIKGDGPAFANILAPVGKAPAAGVCNVVSAYRAFVAGNVDNLYDVWVLFIAAHCQLYSFLNNRALLIDTAAHGRRTALYNLLRNFRVAFDEIIVKSMPRNLAKHLIFQMLNLGVEFPNFIIHSNPAKPERIQTRLYLHPFFG